MKSYYIEKQTPFSEERMKYGWMKRQFGINSEAIIAFKGSFLSQTIKFESEASGIPVPYFFEDMLHVFVEHKTISLSEAKMRLLLLSLLSNQLLGEGFRRESSIIYFNHEQLNLTNIRHNIRAGMIHLGFFIFPEIRHASIVGLDNFDVPVKKFAVQLMQNYCQELNRMEIV